MADELDPRLEARLRDVLRHEADALPFTLTVASLEAGRRNRKPTALRRLGVPVSILAAAAAIVLIVVAGSFLRPPEDVGAPTPNPLAADLASYDELASGITLVDGTVIAKGEDLVGDTPENGLKETVIGAVPAGNYLDIVFDCRGQALSFGVRSPSGGFPGGARPCDQGVTTFTIPTPETPGELVVIAHRDTVWRLVVGGTESAAAADLATFDELAAAAEVAGGEVVAQGADLAGAAEAPSTETRIGDVGAIGSVTFVVDCRGGGSLWVGIQHDGTDAAGGSGLCTDRRMSFSGDVGAGGPVVVRTDPGVVWRAVAVGLPIERLASFDQLAAVATSTHEVLREEQPTLDGSQGTSAYHVMRLGDLWNLEIAIACTGPGEVVITTSGTSGAENRSTLGCSGNPIAARVTLLDTATERAPDASLMLEYPEGTTWRLIVYNRSQDITSLATYEELEAKVAGETTVEGVTFDVPPHGALGVRLDVTATKDGAGFSVPYHAGVHVAGN